MPARLLGLPLESQRASCYRTAKLIGSKNERRAQGSPLNAATNSQGGQDACT